MSESTEIADKEWAAVESVIRHLKMGYDESIVLGGVYGRMRAEIKQLQSANAKMRECLEWYADDDVHTIKRRLLGDFAPITLDKGQRARECLSNLKGGNDA